MLSKLRWNKVLRDAWLHKARSVLVVLAIAVGVAAFGMVLGAREAAKADMYAGYWRNVPPNMILYLDSFDEDVLSIVGDVPGVGQAEARRVVNAKLQPADSERWINLQLSVLQDYKDSRISVVRPQDGDWPPGQREMLLERSAAHFYGIEIGDTVVVEMPNGAQKELPVIGTAHEFNYHSSVISQMARGFVDWDTVAWLGEEVAYNELYVAVAENGTDVAHVERVRTAVIDRLERCGYSVRGFNAGFDSEVTQPGKHWADDVYSAMMLVLGAVGVLTLALSGFLVMNTTLALLAQETRQIGVMKAVGGQRAIGATNWAMWSIVVAEGMLVGLISWVLGALLSYPLDNLLSGGVGMAFVGLWIRYVFAYEGVWMWLLIVIVISALASLAPARHASRISVREALVYE
jgi:putative ABC transport system permease protein